MYKMKKIQRLVKELLLSKYIHDPLCRYTRKRVISDVADIMHNNGFAEDEVVLGINLRVENIERGIHVFFRSINTDWISVYCL
jgi:hypothetical protein